MRNPLVSLLNLGDFFIHIVKCSYMCNNTDKLYLIRVITISIDLRRVLNKMTLIAFILLLAAILK